MNFIFLKCIFTHFIYSEDTEADELLDGAESQNYGYGYGTKVTSQITLSFPPLLLFKRRSQLYLKGNDFPTDFHPRR